MQEQEVIPKPRHRRKPISARRRAFSKWIFNKGMTTQQFVASLPLKPHWVTVNSWRAGMHKPQPAWRSIIKGVYPDCPI